MADSHPERDCCHAGKPAKVLPPATPTESLPTHIQN
jgi:hypothetical protein